MVKTIHVFYQGQAQALRWVTSVAAWPFRQALAAHLAEGPFPLTPQEMKSWDDMVGFWCFLGHTCIIYI